MKINNNSMVPWFGGYFSQLSAEFMTKKEKLVGKKVPSGKHRILIVDNEWNILKLLYSFLKPHYEPIVKNSAVEALKWIHEGNHPSLIICEYQLPHLNGVSFIQLIKNTGMYHKTPVIILSDVEGFELSLKSLPFTIEGVIRKPFDPTHLKNTIQKVLNEHEPVFHY